MSKKISTIFLSLFLIGILSVSCSNADKTGAGETAKGIEQYNNNFYVSTSAVLGSAYLWVSIKDGKVGMLPNNNTTPPDFTGKYMTGPITGSGTDYTFDAGDGKTKGTLTFSSDGSSVTVRFTANPEAPEEMLNTDIVCDIKK